jgi:hypothetical protein
MDGTTTTTSGGAGDEQWSAGAPSSDQPQLLTTAVGDQCANCGAQLAGDQRYCVECGERRGKSRYPVSGSAASSGATSMRGGGRRRPRMTANGTLIAGVGTLLLAMGVGVLIGRSSNSSASKAGVQVVTVAGSGATTGAAPTTASTPTSTTTPSSGSTTSHSKPGAKVTAKSAKSSLQAKLPPKAKVIPKKLASKVAKVGSKCSSGGTFTGTYFGSGASKTGCSK